MRAKIGLAIAGIGVAVAAVGAVPATLGISWAAWIIVFGGFAATLFGLIYAALGPTVDERRASQHVRTVNRHRLENERDALSARRSEIEGERGKLQLWEATAADYSDAPRAAVLRGQIATLTAERDRIDRRLTQIATELASA